LTLEKQVKTKDDVSNQNSHKKETATKSTNQEKISVCDVMKNNTSKIIKKMESQVPSYVQHYSDLYTEYLHMFDDLFGTCYIAEKEFFDKLGLDDKTLKAFDDYFSGITENYSKQIEMSTHLMSNYVKMRISAIQTFDKYMHVTMDSYAMLLSQFNAALKK